MTPEEYAELNGAYPDAPNNPTPSTTGFMDNGGFAWAGKNAESFNAELGFKCKFCGSTAEGLDTWDDDYCSRACEKGIEVCGISDGKGKNGRYGEFCDIQYMGKSDADDNKIIIHIGCPNCEFSEDGWGMSFNQEMKEGYRAESFNAEIEDVSDSMAVITNKFEDMVGAIEVIDDKDDDEVVEVSIQDDELNEVGSYTLDDGVITPYDDYDPRYSMMAEEPVVEYPDWIPAGDGNIVGQQNSAINMSPLHAEGENWIDEECVECGNEMQHRIITKRTVDFMGGVGCNACGGGVCESCDENALHYCLGVENTVGSPSPTFNEDITGQDGPETEPTNSNFSADFGKPTEGDFTTMQVRIGSSSGSTTSWTTSFNIQCVGDEDNLSYLTSDIEDEVVDRVKRWNGDDIDGDQFGDFIPMQIVIGSSSGNSGSWYREFTVMPVGGEDNLSYLASDIEDVVVDRVKRWNGDEVSYNTDTVGTPSPTFNEDITGQDGPETEPTNSNFSAESGISWGSLFIGSAALILGGGLLAKKQGWVGNAEGDDEPKEDESMITDNEPTLVENPNTGDLLRGDYEEMVVQSTGYAVPVIPMSLDGSFMGSRFQALPTDRYVDYNEPGIGAHTDVAMERNTKYLTPAADLVRMNSEDCGCGFLQKIKAFFTGESCGCDEETDVKESQGVGQSPYFQMGKEPVDMDYRVIKEVSPKGLDPAAVQYMPTDWVGQTGQAYVPNSLYGTMYDLGVAGIHPTFNTPNESSTGANRMGDRMAQPDTLSNVMGASLSVGNNASYTDGGETKTLAQWGIENQVSQISDSEAVVISHTSGMRKMIRRV